MSKWGLGGHLVLPVRDEKAVWARLTDSPGAPWLAGGRFTCRWYSDLQILSPELCLPYFLTGHSVRTQLLLTVLLLTFHRLDSQIKFSVTTRRICLLHQGLVLWHRLSPHLSADQISPKQLISLAFGADCIVLCDDPAEQGDTSSLLFKRLLSFLAASL